MFIKHLARPLIVRAAGAQVRTFTRKKPSVGRAFAASGKTRAPLPPARVEDPWEAVTDPEGSYYWNTVTNKTTTIGASRLAPGPKAMTQHNNAPVGGGAK
jgi:hypothetical protein